MVTQDFPPQVGGIQTYSVELARRLAPRCERFAVVAPRDSGWAEVDAELDFPVHRLLGGPDAMRASTVGALPWIARAGRYDVTFHCQWYTAHAGLLLRRLGWVDRVFVAAHGRELLLNVPARHGAWAGQAFAAVRGALVRSVDHWFPVSEYTASLLEEQGVPRPRITAVPNGVDCQRRHPVDPAPWRSRHGLPQGPLLLTLARLVPRKGIDTVLEALVRIRAAVPDVRYAIAGSGSDRPRLEAMAAKLGVTEAVTFLGRVPEQDLNACLSAADVFVMPARSEPPDVEGFGLVFLEANACARPVVGARDGGVVDAIEPGVTGELVPPGDPAALSEVLIELLHDADRAKAMGATGRQRVEQAKTWDHVADRLWAGMHEAL